MKHTVGEIKAGTDVWMIFQELHETKPLQVTILEDNVSTEYMMPRKNIQVHEREGIAKYMQAFIPLKHFAFCNEFCYDTEEEAQKVLNEIIEAKEKTKNELKKKLKDHAISYIIENDLTATFEDEKQKDMFIDGFIACGLYVKQDPIFANLLVNSRL